MAYRDVIATWALSWAREFGRKLGCQLVVETSSHSIKTRMEVPDQDLRAWDPHQFKSGQLYVSGYANPIKPVVKQHTELAEPDTVGIEESEVGQSESDEEEHVQLISSPRYQSYMRQDLISQLLNPSERWRLIAYAVIGLGAIAIVNTMILLNLSGVL